MEALVGGNKKRIIISAVVIVIILALTFTVLFYWLVENDDNIVNIPSQEQFPEINITNVDNIIVEYDSNITVNNISEAGIVFNEFISYNQEQNKHIFYGYYENNWTFVNATGHGYYQGVKYWKINANWYDRDGLTPS